MKWSPRLQLAINTGFIGSFTTFSTFSVETVELFRGGEIGMAIAYVLLSLWGGLGLAWAGFALAKRKEGMKRDA
nr:CrcB family protein [Paenibacillus larvae]